MPCGGIWTPEPGSFWLDHECWVCRERGCELFCDEWDTCLHVRCLGKFLETEEGKIVLMHGHGINIPDRINGDSWPGVAIERQEFTLPTHCLFCGVYLMGGATQHKSDCQIPRINREVVKEPLVRIATNEEQRAALVEAARFAIASGATHDCGEWFKGGVCELCGRVEEPPQICPHGKNVAKFGPCGWCEKEIA